RSPSARPRLTSGIKQTLFMPSAAASLYPSPPPGQPLSSTVATIGFIVSNARLPGSFSAGVMIRSPLAKPLLTGESSANSLNVPVSSPGSQIPAPSQRITSQNEAATARFCDLLTILIGDITFDITQVLPSAHYVGFRTQSRSPDRSKEVDAQRCGPERFERREGGSKSHAHCRVGQIA